jgi:hypothetical protein
MKNKPEVVSYDFGRHNNNIEAATLRVIEAATWKKANIAVIIPASNLVPAKCALSWMNLIFPPNNGVVRILTQNMEIGEAYNAAIQTILDHPNFCNYQYILTLEHDNVPPPDGVLKLAKCMDENPEFSAISGLYWTKGELGVPQIWGDINDTIVNYRAQAPKGEIQECYGIGMGFALWRMEMFKNPKLEKPWFKTTAHAGGVGTQDLYFWTNNRKFGYRCAVANTVRVGHYDNDSGICW